MIIRVEHTKDFTITRNKSLRDSRLSFRAVGMLCHLLSLPDDAPINHRQLALAHVEGEKAVLTALKELETCGYLARRRLREPDGRWRWESTLRERPKPPTGDNHAAEKDAWNDAPVRGFTMRPKPGDGKRHSRSLRTKEGTASFGVGGPPGTATAASITPRAECCEECRRDEGAPEVGPLYERAGRRLCESCVLNANLAEVRGCGSAAEAAEVRRRQDAELKAVGVLTVRPLPSNGSAPVSPNGDTPATNVHPIRPEKGTRP